MKIKVTHVSQMLNKVLPNHVGIVQRQALDNINVLPTEIQIHSQDRGNSSSNKADCVGSHNSCFTDLQKGQTLGHNYSQVNGQSEQFAQCQTVDQDRRHGKGHDILDQYVQGKGHVRNQVNNQGISDKGVKGQIQGQDRIHVNGRDRYGHDQYEGQDPSRYKGISTQDRKSTL